MNKAFIYSKGIYYTYLQVMEANSSIFVSPPDPLNLLLHKSRLIVSYLFRNSDYINVVQVAHSYFLKKHLHQNNFFLHIVEKHVFFLAILDVLISNLC